MSTDCCWCVQRHQVWSHLSGPRRGSQHGHWLHLRPFLGRTRSRGCLGWCARRHQHTPDVILWEHAWDAFVIPCERATTIYQQTTRIRFHQAMVILFSICLEVYMGPLHIFVLQLKALVCGKVLGSLWQVYSACLFVPKSCDLMTLLNQSKSQYVL